MTNGIVIDRFKSFLKDNQGSAAVELAFVAVPFLWLIFVILELGFIFMVHLVLDHAVDETKRLVLVGDPVIFNEVNGSDAQLEAFRDGVCGYTAGLIDCDELRIFTDTGDDCSTITFPSTFQGFGSSSNCTIIRTEYNWRLLIPSFTAQLSGADDGSYLIVLHNLALNEAF